ncbi:MAG: transcriptional repressor [Candidatus Omnitrophica bacterium]|nr:transcriptional repressor [Candidatus Omnitrophota bacterium]
MKQADIMKTLEDNGIQASYQRMKIFEYLVKNRTHPTVEDIYRYLSSRIPTLSKTTIYNTLKVFVDKKIISQVTVEEKEVRYDFSEGAHLHFKCKKCGELYDIFHKCSLLDEKEIDGHSVDEHHLYLKGLCKNCRKN